MMGSLGKLSLVAQLALAMTSRTQEKGPPTPPSSASFPRKGKLLTPECEFKSASHSRSSGPHPHVTPHPKVPRSSHPVSGWGKGNDYPEIKGDSASL